MFSKKEKEPMPDFSDVHVKLKPVFGLKPGLYLTLLYAVIIVLIIFFTLFYPGISKNGSYIKFLSTPREASVWVDNAFKGITPCEVFVEQGEHTIEFRKAFYKTESINKKIEGRIFGTILFPLRATIKVNITIEDYNGLLEYAKKDFTEWGMLNEFVSNYHLPPILSKTAEASRDLKTDDNINKLYDLIKTAAYFTDTRAELQELIKALIVTETRGRVIDSGSIASLIKKIKQFINEHDNFPYWLIYALPKNLQDDESGLTQKDIIGSDWFQEFNKNHLSELEEISTDNPGGTTGKIILNTIGLRLIPGGTYFSGNDLAHHNRLNMYFPYPVTVNSFYISETEITNSQFYRFILENPGWSKNNLENLIEEGKVTVNYLSDWNNNSYIEGMENYPVLYVSYYAAEAFCRWLDSKLPSSLQNYTVRLPYESEWEWAAASNGEDIFENAVLNQPGVIQESGYSKAGKFGIKDLIGNAWEWCGEYYFPVKNLLASLNPEKNNNTHDLTGSEMIVKGGSYANAKDDISVFTRGSQPPDWCTEYLGFRIAVSR